MASVVAIAVRVPPSLSRIRQLKAQFAVATRFNLVLIGPDEETIARLKKQLIRWPSVSEEAKLSHLLNELTLGDRTTSQLLRELRQLGGDKVGWELRLPESTRAILVCTY